ncbi:MAG: hypothetical protein H7Y27_00490 [Gemmatimonadaceae bacterium]|nr:hypothetical protein [Chitinophagaceae bacterium]
MTSDSHHSSRNSLNQEEITDIINTGHLYTDSMEVAVSYYNGKLLELEQLLNDHNIQEHPHEIVKLAHEIQNIRTTLKNLTRY